MTRDDLLAQEYECLLTIWDLEGKIELVETPTEVQLFYREGALQEMAATWDSLESHQKIWVATLVGLHFGIPITAEDLACMKLNGLNSSAVRPRERHEHQGPTWPKSLSLDDCGVCPQSLTLFCGE